MQPAAARYEPRSGRFDVSFEIANDSGAPAKLRFTGIAIETVEAAVLTRNVERNEILKSSDVIDRAPPESRDRQRSPRRAVKRSECRCAGSFAPARRCGPPISAKPDLVQRDDNVTLIYQSAGLYLTIRGKALDNGAEGDVVSVLNLQSKRTVSGVVIGRGPGGDCGRNAAASRRRRPTPRSGQPKPHPISVAASNSSPVAPKAE